MTTPAPNVLECPASDKGKEITPPDGIVPLDSPPTSGETKEREGGGGEKKDGGETSDWRSVQRKRKGTKDGKVQYCTLYRYCTCVPIDTCTKLQLHVLYVP